MRRFILLILAAGPLALGAAAAQADWTGKGELGYVMARGNTETDTANAKLAIAREAGNWKNSLAAGLLYAKNNDVDTADRWDARWQTDYALSPRAFWFGALRYEQDRFSGFKYQGVASTGIGYKFIDTEATKFSGTLGAGYRRLQTETLIKNAAGEVIQRIAGDTGSDVIANGGLDFQHALTATTRVIDKLLVESGSDNTFVQNDLALEVSMTDRLALSLGYGLRHNSDPPAGLGKTDRLTTVNLVYNIK